jgi:hypothetical protein
MSFEKLVRPDLPEAHTPQAQQGLISGWVPAILNRIESSDDPEGLGRVKVQCDLLAINQTLPNSWDGMVWVLEEYVCNGKEGGAHRYLQPGSQVALLPMFGNPKYMLMLGALHSRVDKPNPIFDRSIEVHGTQSPGQIFKIKDDRNTEETHAFPHGVTSQVTRTGDKIDQTQGGARNHLQQDGTNRVENSKSSIVQSKDGQITQRSAGDATQILTADGRAYLRAEASKNELKLEPGTSELLGPAPELTGLKNQAKKLLGGQLGQAQELLKNLGLSSTLLGNLGSSTGSSTANQESLAELATSASEFLGQLSNGIGSTLQTGINVLKEIQKQPIADLGQTLFDQVEASVASGIGALLPALQEILAQKPSLSEINRFLSASDVLTQPIEESAANINVLKGLGHSLDLQAEFILSKALPEGYDSFKNLSALGIADKVEPISNLFDEAKSILEGTAPLLPSQTLPIAQQLEQQQQRLQDIPAQILGTLPKELQGFISPSLIKGLVNGGDFEAGITGMLGSIAKGFNGQTISSLTKALPFSNALPDMQKLTDAIAKGQFSNLSQMLSGITSLPGLSGLGSLTGNPSQMLSQMFSGLTQQFGQMLGDAQKQLTKFVNSIGEQIARAKVQVDKFTSELRAKLGKHRVYATEKGVGAQSPYGGFDFGKDGGLMKSLGKMVMQVIGKGSGGLTLDPKLGALLQGFDKTGQTALSSVQASGSRINVSAAQTAISGETSIRSASGDWGLHVQDNGVYLNDFALQQIFPIPGQIQFLLAQMVGATGNITALDSRVTAIEVAGGGGSGGGVLDGGIF